MVSPYLIVTILVLASHASEFCDNEDWTKIGIGLVTDQILIVGGTIERLLDLMWSHCISEEIMAAVDEEELEDLRQTYEGFKDTLERIRATELEDNVNIMFCFYMDLNNEHFKFAESDLARLLYTSESTRWSRLPY